MTMMILTKATMMTTMTTMIYLNIVPRKIIPNSQNEENQLTSITTTINRLFIGVSAQSRF